MKKFLFYVVMMWPLFLGMTSVAHACFAPSPSSLTIPVGGTGNFSEVCSSTCVASVSASSSNPAVATVTPSSQSIGATPKTSTVTGISAGSSVININWSCPAFGSGSFAVSVTVEAPVPVSTGTSGGNYITSATCGEPVNMFTGELFNRYEPDMDLGGSMPLLFSRYYASGLKVANISGKMGDNWLHNFEWSLSGIATAKTIVSSIGRVITFNKTGLIWQLSGRTDIPYQLAEDAGTGNFTLAVPDSNQTYVFNASGRLISINDNHGGIHTLIYSGSLLTQVSDGLGRTLNFSYNVSNQLITVSDGLGRSVSFTYTANDLTGVTDLLGNATTFTYAGGGLMTGSTLPAGNTHHTQIYNPNGSVASQTDALGNANMLGFAANSTWIDPLGQSISFTHTTTGELSNSVRKDNSSVAISSNAAGQRSGVTDSLGAFTGFGYHAASGRLSSIAHANGATTSYTFAARALAGGVNLFDRTGITHADNATETFAHDVNGNITSRTDRAGNIFSFTYNANGQMLTATNPLTGIVTNTYNVNGTKANSSDPFGNTTTFAYDAFRRPLTISFADASTNSFTWDAKDRPLTETDARAGVTTYVYDANGNLTSTTDRVGTTTTYSYDLMDRVNKITDANAAFSTVTYDALERQATTTDRNGNTTRFGYDMQSRLASITDGNGNIWLRTFDTEGILTASTTALGNITGFSSDNMGRITQISSPLGNTIGFTYDNMGRITQSTDPLGNISVTTYDARGLIASKTLPGAITVSYIRNALGRTTQVTDPNSNNWQRTIDTAGRVSASTDPLARSQSFAFDNRNRVSAVTFPGGLGTRSNSYDANGNLTRKLFSDGTDLNFTFDAEERLLTTNGLTLSRDNLGRITDSNGITMAYNAGGRITGITYAIGKTVTYTYDANSNIKTVADWVGGSSTFTYDADNHLATMTRPNGVTTTYTYDNDGRLTGFADGTLASTTLTRDAKGQITAASRAVPIAAGAASMTTATHTFDAAAQVSTTGFTYDAMGRQTNNGATAFVWDLASRLTSAGAATHTYDGNGYRLRRSTTAGTRNYVWNYALDLPSVSIEKQGSADLRYYVHTPDGALLYSIDAVGDIRHFYHFDEIGNTRFVSSDAGVIEAGYVYSPFGLLLASTGVLDNPFTWQGQSGLFNDGNDLYYVRARYYDANSARFISSDPINKIQRIKLNQINNVSEFNFRRLNLYFASHPTLLNDYQYAANNPLQYRDVSGKLLGFNLLSKLGGFLKDGANSRLDDANADVAARNQRLLDRIAQGEDPDDPGFLKKEENRSVGPGQAAIDIALGKMVINNTIVDRTLRASETLRDCNPLIDDLPGDVAVAVVAGSSPKKNKSWGERVYDAFWAAVTN